MRSAAAAWRSSTAAAGSSSTWASPCGRAGTRSSRCRRSPGLADGSDPSLAGVIISHPHLDHYGLIDQVHPSVPVYIGREASLLLAEAEFFSAAGVTLHPTGFLAHRVPIQVGAFTVTPYLADHSGYDSYSLLVEAGGKRLFYTGDIRGHGRKARLFEELLADPPEGIDVLLCEGTHIRAVDAGPGKCRNRGSGRSEVDVELSLAHRLMRHRGSRHGDLVGPEHRPDGDCVRACLRAGRTLVTDLYTASIVAAIGRSSIPRPGFPKYKVYVPNRQRVQVKASGQFDRMELVEQCRVFPEWLARARRRDHFAPAGLMRCPSYCGQGCWPEERWCGRCGPATSGTPEGNGWQILWSQPVSRSWLTTRRVMHPWRI